MSVLGIRFRLHPLFVLVAASSVLTGQFAELSVLFCIVLVHEFGHIAAARGFGWKVREVRLLPFGGVAVMEPKGIPPLREEVAVSLAGPLQNVLLMLVSALFAELGVWSASWAHFFLQANLLIALFNLLPILPLDGGKILQAFLDSVLPYYRSLTAGIRISLAFSALLVLWSLVRPGAPGIHLNLLLIGLFLLYSNIVSFRHVPFQFVRFLAFRLLESEDPRRRPDRPIPEVASSRSSLPDLLRRIRRNRSQLFFLVGPGGTPERVVSERSLLLKFFAPDPGGGPPVAREPSGPLLRIGRRA